MKQLTLLIFSLISISSTFGQTTEQPQEFSNYQEMRDYFGKLYENKKYEEASNVMQKALFDFTGHTEANAFNLAITYLKLEKFDKCTDALQYGLDHGIWYSTYAFLSNVWDPCRELEKFEAILARNEELRQAAQKLAKPEMLVVMPEVYEGTIKYPLFIALHGGNSNIDNFKKAWKSEKLEKEFITIYLQSSQIVAMNGFNWTEDIEITKKEIIEAYNKILMKYPIDKNEIIIGGFSSGGVAAMEISFCNSIPVKGFISLCPGMPDSFTEENIIKAKDRGVSSVILTTEMDPRLEEQKEMSATLNNAGLNHQFIITPNIGHWFPEDLDVKIDEAIEFILK